MSIDYQNFFVGVQRLLDRHECREPSPVAFRAWRCANGALISETVQCWWHESVRCGGAVEFMQHKAAKEVHAEYQGTTRRRAHAN